MYLLETMNKDERSLLLFFETCAVDHRGKVDARHMNDADLKIAETWNKSKFVQFGRIKFKDITPSVGVSKLTHWCLLSDEAWKLAHEERVARAKRMKQYGEELLRREVDEAEISLCPHCFCATKTIRGICGKCKGKKNE